MGKLISESSYTIITDNYFDHNTFINVEFLGIFK